MRAVDPHLRDRLQREAGASEVVRSDPGPEVSATGPGPQVGRSYKPLGMLTEREVRELAGDEVGMDEFPRNQH